MKSKFKFMGAAAVLLSVVLPVHADVTLNSTRILADDVLAVAAFYQQAFGMHEVQRINLQGGAVEVMLNFGDSVEAAKANPAAQIVIMPRAADAPADTTVHLIFNSTDMVADFADIRAAGGSIVREPFEYQGSGLFIGIAADPAGNQLEFLQQPAL
jgi:predicted enzyme related to lactoylglutathione lyase